MKKTAIYLAFLCSIVLTSSISQAATDASSLLVKVYGVAVSTSLDCSSPLVIFDSTDGVEKNFLDKPTLGGGDIADGTYPCVMITMSDTIKFKPSANTGSYCVAGTEYTIDVCRTDNSGTTNLRTGTTLGASTPCTGTSSTPAADKVTMYLRTNSTNASAAFNSPSSTSDTSVGIALTNAFVVSGTSSGAFVVDARGKVQDEGSACGMDAPTFSFR